MTLTPEELRAIDIASETLQRLARARGASRAELTIGIDGRVDVWLAGDKWGVVHARGDLLVGGPDPMPSVAVQGMAVGGT